MSGDDANQSTDWEIYLCACSALPNAHTKPCIKFEVFSSSSFRYVRSYAKNCRGHVT